MLILTDNAIFNFLYLSIGYQIYSHDSPWSQTGCMDVSRKLCCRSHPSMVDGVFHNTAKHLQVFFSERPILPSDIFRIALIGSMLNRYSLQKLGMARIFMYAAMNI